MTVEVEVKEYSMDDIIPACVMETICENDEHIARMKENNRLKNVENAIKKSGIIRKINNIIREAEVGKIYEAKVVRIEKFGCFVEIWDGCEGLVHISKLAKERVEKVEDVVKVGDQILVKCIGIDEKGRIDFSRKDAFENNK